MPASLPPALIDAVLRIPTVAACVRTQSDESDTVLPPRTYVGSAFDVRTAKVGSGETLTIFIGSTGCLTQGQASHVYAFAPSGSGYRKVLDGFVMDPSAVDVAGDTIVLPAHETINTIVEQAYVWNGSAYELSVDRTTVYEVGASARAPYQTRVRFAPGTSYAVLNGTYSENFGRTYVFRARKGQRIGIDLLSYGGEKMPEISLWIGDTDLGASGRKWSGIAPRDGTYSLDIFGSGVSAEEEHNFSVELSIR